MTLNILFAAGDDRWDQYKEPLRAAFEAAKLDVDLSRDHGPAETDYIVFAPNGPVSDFTPYTRTKAVMNLWAGVENIVGNDTLTQPLTRMVDEGLTQGMVEWVVGHTLRHHLGIDAHILGQDGEWRKEVPPLAQDRKVTILGLGALGAACGKTLCQLGFDVSGWSRSAKDVAGLTCYATEERLEEAMKGAEILILLLPLTEETENILNGKSLNYLAPGAVVINPGRGALIDDDALLLAIDRGQIGHATLDTFREEPLPADHPFWVDPKITVTPHIASETRPSSAARVIAENVRRGEAGEPFLHLVDKDRGY